VVHITNGDGWHLQVGVSPLRSLLQGDIIVTCLAFSEGSGAIMVTFPQNTLLTRHTTVEGDERKLPILTL
jgi:hypothetical protein